MVCAFRSCLTPCLKIIGTISNVNHMQRANCLDFVKYTKNKKAEEPEVMESPRNIWQEKKPEEAMIRMFDGRLDPLSTSTDLLPVCFHISAEIWS